MPLDTPAGPPAKPHDSGGALQPAAADSLRWFRLGLIGLNMMAAALCALMLRNQLQSDTALSNLQAANTAALLARGTAATLDKARLAVDSVADRLESDLNGPGVQRAVIWPMVDRAVERVPELQTIGLFDSSGAQICGAAADRCRALSVADRDYFARYRETPTASPGLYGPVDSRLDGRPALILARALRHADGRFAGVAIGLLPLQNLHAIVASASLGPGGVASLRLAGSLTLLARAPVLAADQQARQIAALTAAIDDPMRRNPQAGTFTVKSPADGATRINAYQLLSGYPVYALVGDSLGDSQAAWRSLLVWTCVSLLVFAALSLAIERAVTRGRRSGVRAQQLFDEAPCGYHTLDAQGRFTNINATELGWLGRRKDEIVGKSRAVDYFTPEGRATFAENFPRILSGETLRGLELDLVAQGGRIRRVLVDASPLLDNQGRFLSSNTVMVDITALHQARQELQQQNARQQLLLDNRLVGIARVKDRRFVWANAAFEGLFGYEPAELVGRETAILYPNQASFAAMGEAAISAFAQGGTYRATVELRRRDGTAIWADCSGAVLDDASGEVFWISKDVTESRRAEALRIESADLAAENRQLQETARLHAMFLANMSHELRTPLNAIIGFADLLQMPAVVADGEKRARYLRQIGASGKHLLAMIDSLLELAKVEGGRVALQPVQLDPADVVQDVIDMLEAKAQAKSVEVTAEVTTLPAVTVDPVRLKQVLLNYLDNAIKFSPSGGRVVVRALMPCENTLRIEVKDEGIGITSVDQARLFVRFQQLSAGATKSYEGTGIGLALVRQIVEAQGGQVGVRSELGEGSVFWAEWPVEP